MDRIKSSICFLSQVLIKVFSNEWAYWCEELTYRCEHFMQRFIGTTFVGIDFFSPESSTITTNIPVIKLIQKDHYTLASFLCIIIIHMLSSVSYEIMKLRNNPYIQFMGFWCLWKSIETGIFDTLSIKHIFMLEIIKILRTGTKYTSMRRDKYSFALIICDNILKSSCNTLIKYIPWLN